ncbi:MAG: hypothetical protein A2491_04955 [Bacteroidetes bacterium RIFOXYC12_FULL_35_7]|nr:MAG: hypothetical protein A2491_04955 [Bacteroidetes bacterium RIFOXYC12_FULL_35_7]
MSEHSTSWLKQPPVVCPVTLVLKTSFTKVNSLVFNTAKALPTGKAGLLSNILNQTLTVWTDTK